MVFSYTQFENRKRIQWDIEPYFTNFIYCVFIYLLFIVSNGMNIAILKLSLHFRIKQMRKYIDIVGG